MGVKPLDHTRDNLRIMLQVGNTFYAFDDYDDDHLNARIAYWESCLTDDWCGVLSHMYAERDRRVDDKLLAWVEQK